MHEEENKKVAQEKKRRWRILKRWRSRREAASEETEAKEEKAEEAKAREDEAELETK